MKTSVHRRTFLRSVGVGVAALPFVRLVERSYAQSLGQDPPQRFIGLYHPHGIAAELFTMRDTDTETNFALDYPDSSLQPFDDPATYGQSFKDRIVVIEGLDLLSNTNGHQSAATILTGSLIFDHLPRNSSLDQFLAVEQGLGAATPVTSVALAVGNKDLDARETLSFGQGGIPLSKIVDPALAYDFLFQQTVIGSDPAARTSATRQRKLGQSLIDFVRGDVNRLRTRLAPIEQQKLDQHLDALRGFEKKLQAAETSTCKKPQRPGAFPALLRYNGGEPYFDAITDLHIDLMALAMACDITRFATLVMGDLSYTGNPLGLPADNHAAVAHTYAASALGNQGKPVTTEKPETWRMLAKLNRYSYGKVARLMQRLAEAGILDSTLIYASSDMGNPAMHSTRNVPTVLAGGANGKLRMGRRIKYRVDQTMPNNLLLTSIAKAFGVPLDSYGWQLYDPVAMGTLAEI